MKNLSMKHRIILSIVGLLTLTSAFFGTGLLMIQQKLEEATFGKMVHQQIEAAMLQPDAEKILANPLFHDWNFYRGSDISHLPEEIRELSPGAYHSVKVGDKHYQIEVVEGDIGHEYMVYDITSWEEQEHLLLHLLAAGVIMTFFAAILVGKWVVTPILSPVHRFTHRLTEIQPRDRKVRIGDEFANCEIAQIGEAFDRYLTRLDSFVEREQSFTAAASHELRTPLSVIVGALDILDINVTTPPQRRALQRIRRATTDMQAFIEATLFLSREDSNTLVDQPATSLRNVVQELITETTPVLEMKGITLEQSLKDDVVIQQPRSILLITIGNILKNAIEHSQGDHLTITVRENVLQIRDNGVGISVDDQHQIYEASYSTKPGGTGLGLNLVRRICDRFQWTLTLDSQPGGGTTFTIVFNPADVPDATPSQRETTPFNSLPAHA